MTEQTIVASMQAEIERLQTELALAKDEIADMTAQLSVSNDEVAQIVMANETKMTAEIERLNAQLDESFHLNVTLIKRTEFLDAEIKRLRAVSNTVDQYIQIQDCQNGKWHTLSQRFSMDKQQHAIDELAKWRERFPAGKFRPVSIAVTLLVPEGAPEQENG